jgi:hypothetical protein
MGGVVIGGIEGWVKSGGRKGETRRRRVGRAAWGSS